MLSHDPASAPEPSDPIPGDGDRLQPVRRSFPVPKRKAAAIENDDEPVEFDRPAWGIRAVLASAVIMAGAAAWMTFGRGGGREPKNASPASATAPPEPRREISQDPAVEIYFAPSTPAPGEPGGESELSSQPAPAVERPAPAESPRAANAPRPPEEDGVFEILNDPPK